MFASGTDTFGFALLTQTSLFYPPVQLLRASASASSASLVFMESQNGLSWKGP